MRDRQLVALVGAVILLATAQITFQGFFLLYLVDHVHVDLPLGGVLLATATAAGACMRIAWGGISDALLGGARRPVAIASTMLAVAGLAMLPLASRDMPLPVLFMIAAVAGAGATGWTGPVNTLRAEQAGPDRVTAYSALASGLGNLAPVVGAPLFGAMVDRFDSYVAGWLMLAGFSALAVVLVSRVRDPAPFRASSDAD